MQALRHQHPSGDGESTAVTYLATIARALVDMRGLATAISASQRVAAAEGDLIARLLPSLAAAYGLRASMRRNGSSVTVRFETRSD